MGLYLRPSFNTALISGDHHVDTESRGRAAIQELVLFLDVLFNAMIQLLLHLKKVFQLVLVLPHSLLVRVQLSQVTGLYDNRSWLTAL
jgi:hypothetical protein